MTLLELHKLLIERKLSEGMYFWGYDGQLLFKYYRPDGTQCLKNLIRLRSGRFQFLFTISGKLNSYWVNIIIDKVVERFTKLLRDKK